mgnify:CR=1 FL=1
MSSFLFDGLHNGLGQVLDLRMSQHSLTASNLANADTPGYKAKFIPFDRVLGEAVNQGKGMRLRATHALHNVGLDANVSDPSVDEIEAVYSARVNQLRQLKAFKAAAREQMELEGAANYDQKRATRERKLREQREHQYRMAVEARRIAEARAARWWSIWAGRSYSPILIFN